MRISVIGGGMEDYDIGSSEQINRKHVFVEAIKIVFLDKCWCISLAFARFTIELGGRTGGSVSIYGFGGV
jgi:hypothetical protein